jgi:hypothetical protein
MRSVPLARTLYLALIVPQIFLAACPDDQHQHTTAGLTQHPVLAARGQQGPILVPPRTTQRDHETGIKLPSALVVPSSWYFVLRATAMLSYLCWKLQLSYPQILCP